MPSPTNNCLRSDYKRYEIMFKHNLEQWNNYYNELEEKDRYAISEKMELFLIPAILNLAFALECFCNHWVYVFHPIQKYEFKLTNPSNRKQRKEFKNLVKQFKNQIIFGSTSVATCNKVSSLLLFSINNIFDVNYSSLTSYSKSSTSQTDPLQFNPKDITSILSSLSNIRNKLSHNSPYNLHNTANYLSDKSNPLFFIKTVNNNYYLDSLSNEEFIVKVGSFTSELNKTKDIYNYFTQLIAELSLPPYVLNVQHDPHLYPIFQYKPVIINVSDLYSEEIHQPPERLQHIRKLCPSSDLKLLRQLKLDVFNIFKF